MGRKTLKNGEAYRIKRHDILFDYTECCDCGLVHLNHYFVDKEGAITVMTYRDDDDTRQVRKENGIVVYRRKLDKSKK